MAEKSKGGYVVPHNPNPGSNRSQRRNGTFSYQPKPQPRNPDAKPGIKQK